MQPLWMIENAKEVIFALFFLPMKGGEPQLESRKFLGTGFFVSRLGDAMTAAHTLPKPESVDEDHWVVAALKRDGQEVLCRILHGAAWPKWDLALFKVSLGTTSETTRYLELPGVETPAGTDVELIGVPDHEVWNSGKEMRMLKGHVTMTVPPWLELSCSIPLEG